MKAWLELRPLRQWIARRTVCRNGCAAFHVVRERELGTRTIHVLGVIPLEVRDVEFLAACRRCGATKQVTVSMGIMNKGERRGTD